MQTISDHEDGAVQDGPRVSRREAEEQDAYWQRRFWQERYYRWDLEYEDYAPAYCVGYVGRVQYGADFVQAEASLCANWLRIKGDSRLTLAEAMQAMRAAWDRIGGRHERSSSFSPDEPGPQRPRRDAREESPVTAAA